MANGERGALILLEGIDRSGKTTQAKLLREQLEKEGLKVDSIRFPDRATRTGKVIDEYLKSSNGEDDLNDRAVHLLFSANRWESAQRIKELLEAGTHVILDRYAHSGVAYTMAKGNISMLWCCAPDIGLPEPDCIFYLNVPVDVAEKRGGFGGERYETEAFQQLVADSYKHVLRVSRNVVTIKADDNEQEVHQRIMNHLRGLKDPKPSSPVGKLWWPDTKK